MNPEKAIVNLWLHRQGFFTIADINAKNRVIDLLAVKQKKGEVSVRHVEVSCSVSSSTITESYKQELLRKFTDPNVVEKVKRSVKSYLGYELEYEKVLVTNSKIDLPNVNVIQFEDVFHEVVENLDTQNYRDPVVRTLQLFKYVLLSNPDKVSALIASGGEHKAMTSAAREKLTKDLLSQDNISKSFGKKSSEEVLVELLKKSTLRQPERLAKALEEVLTKRTATRFLNVLLQQKNIKTAVKEEIKKDQSLQDFFK
ncbi:hypothetical protein JXB11_02075 [Candidatus Woesearchaeota archaeon]|nr:hypothetical protein [Candidatus Woesearchaeota archaeon]